MPGARVAQPDRLHRAPPQGVGAALRHDFDRQAALEIRRRLFPFVEFGFLAGQQGSDERLVLRAVERAVDVIRPVAPRPDLVVARLEPGLAEIDRVAVHDRRERVKKGERILAGQQGQGAGQCRRGQGPGGDDDRVPLGRRQAGDLFSPDLDQLLGHQRRLDRAGKAGPVDRQRAARRQFVGIGGMQDQGSATPHLLVQQADGVALGVVRAERVRAHQLGQPLALMRRGRAHRAHLVQHRGHAGACHLPRRLAARQSAADDVDRVHQGSGAVARPCPQDFNPVMQPDGQWKAWILWPGGVCVGIDQISRGSVGCK